MYSLGGFMTAWYKIKGNKLGWWRKYRGERGRWERICFVPMIPEPSDPFSTPSPPRTAAFAHKWCRAWACGPLLLEWVGRGTVPWSLPSVFPKTSSQNWQFKNMMMVNSQSSCWRWEVGKFPAAEPHYCIRAKLPIPIFILLPAARCRGG